MLRIPRKGKEGWMTRKEMEWKQGQHVWFKSWNYGQADTYIKYSCEKNNPIAHG